MLYVSNPLDHANLVDRSTDGGNTWTSIFSTNTIQDQDYNLAYSVQKSFVMDPINSSRLLIGTTQIWQTTDAQDPSPTWTAYSPVLSNIFNPPGDYITALAISANGQTVYAATADGHVWVNGPNWPEIDQGLFGKSSGHVVDMRVDPNDPTQVYAVTNDNGGNNVWHLQGGSWTNISGNFPSNLGPETIFADFQYNVPALFVGTWRGAYRSMDGGQHWTNFGPGLPNTVVSDLQSMVPPISAATGQPSLPGPMLAAATYGRGAWEIILGVTAGVVNGNLQIGGDDQGDVITVELDSMNPALLDVWEGVANNPFDRLVGSFAVASLTSATVTTGSGNCTVNIEDSVAGIPVTVNLGDGTDTVNISPFGQTLDNIQANVTINPGLGFDTLNVDDQQAKLFLAQYSVTGSIIDRGTGAIGFSGISAVNLNAGVSAVYMVSGTEDFYTTTLNTGNGFATVDVQATGSGSTLNIVGGGGAKADVVNVGNNGSVQGIAGIVNIENPPSYNTITVDDSADTTTRTTSLGTFRPSGDSNWGFISGLAPANINYEYADTTSITIKTGTGGNTIDVLATAVTTNLVGNFGGTTVNVGNAGSVQGITGTLNIENPLYFSTIVLDDHSNPTAHTALNPVTLSTLGTNPSDSEGNAHPWGQIIGLAPAHINYEYEDTTSLTINGGTKGNVFDVQATGNLFGPGNRTTTLNTGAGNDTINVGDSSNTLKGIQGAVTVNGQGGTNTLNINDQGTPSGSYTVSSAVLSRLAPTAVSIPYGTVKTVNLNTGTAGGATLTVLGPVPTTTISFNASGGANTLVGANVSNTWDITGTNIGTLGKVNFFDVQNLTGGTNYDDFKFVGAAANITGNINGGGGTADKLDYSGNGGGAITVTLTGPSSVTASSIGGTFSNIESLVGSSNTGNKLTGANSLNNWDITTKNGGKVNTFSFTNIPNLVGGSGLDIFKFANSLLDTVASIDGGGGDWLDYSGFAAAVAVNLVTNTATNVTGSIHNIQNVHGGSSTTTLTGDSQGNILIGGSAGGGAITGGTGRSLLIADKGGATINGASSAGDILIADSTTFDTDTNAHLQALMSILAEWQSADSYTDRFNDINKGTTYLPGSHHNGTNVLKWGTTVKDDPLPDAPLTVTAASGSGLDWFFVDTNDTAVNFVNGDHKDNT